MTEKKEIRLSPTSIITYKRCPREFYYNYIARIPTPINVHLIKGTMVHSVFEWFFSKKYRPDFEVYAEELFWRAFEENKEKWDTLRLDENESNKQINDCLNMVSLYIMVLRIKIDDLKKIGKAKNDRHAFYMLRPKLKELWLEDKELNLCGYVDRIHTDYDGKVIIGDYKTSSRFGIGLKDEYELQGGIYALLYKRCQGKIADYVSIIYLRYGEEVVTRVTPDLINHALETYQYVRDNTHSTDEQDYPKKESGFCKWCSFFDKCSGIEKKEQSIKIEKAIQEMKNGETKTPETD